MAQGNVYKPRYKIAYQSKNKIWPHKNSRLRRFFNIRGRKLVRRGFFKRYVLVFNNMKWVIARRYIRPYMRRRRAVRRQYRNAFYAKQQLRHFHGKVKEEAFKKFIRNHLTSITKRNTSFFAMLEKRLDVFFFRLRLLPTVFACNQLIHHHGVLVNNGLIKTPHAILRAGDIVAIGQKQWTSFYWYLYYRMYYRIYGKYLLRKRQYSILKKKIRWLRRTRIVTKPLFLRRHREVLLAFFNLRLRFLYFFEKYLSKIYGVIKKYKHQTQMIAFAKKKLIKLLHLKNIFISLFVKIKAQNKKFVRQTKTYWNAKRFNKLRNYHKELFWLVGIIHSQTKNLAYLWLRIRLEELSFYSVTCDFLCEGNEKNKIHLLIKNRSEILVDKYLLLRRQLQHHFSLLLRRSVRRETVRAFKKYNTGLQKQVPQGNPLLYFIVRKNFKKNRRRAIPRLKNVHWYIPKYIHFDFRTLRAMLLYSPLPEEIFYSFRCSLPKIHSFYKSLAY